MITRHLLKRLDLEIMKKYLWNRKPSQIRMPAVRRIPERMLKIAASELVTSASVFSQNSQLGKK